MLRIKTKLYCYSTLLAVSLFLQSCNTHLSGKYIRTKDNDRASSIAGIFNGLITEVEFTEPYCHFKYFGILMNGEYKIEKNYVYVTTGSELGVLRFEIIDDNTLEGEGWAYGTFIKGIQHQQ